MAGSLQTDSVGKALFEQFARMGKAFAHAHRLELLELLAQTERTVESLAKAANLTVANTSQHLQQLRHACLVTTRKEGLHVHYRLADESVLVLLDVLHELAEKQLAEVNRLITTRLPDMDGFAPVSAEELMQQMEEKQVTLVDVRPAEEYAAGHLPDAINIPMENLENDRFRLPAEQEVVAYCRGPYCVLAYDAAARLRKKGFDARRLKEGYPEWKLKGFPVEES